MSGLAPGKFAETLIVGKSTCGKGAVGSCKKATNPARAIAAVSNAVAIGRRMNGAEIPSSPVLVRQPDWHLANADSCQRRLRKAARALFRGARAGELRGQSIKEEVDNWRCIKRQHLTNQ